MSRVAASIERKPSEVPSDAYNGICSRLEDTWSVGIEGKEFIESPVSRARPQPTPPEYQERNSVVNSKVNRPRRRRARWARPYIESVCCRLQQTTSLKNGAHGAQYCQLIEFGGRGVGSIEIHTVPKAAHASIGVWTPLG